MARWLWLCLMAVAVALNRGEENSVGVPSDWEQQSAVVGPPKGLTSQAGTEINHETSKPSMLAGLLSVTPAASSRDTPPTGLKAGAVSQNVSDREQTAGSQQKARVFDSFLDFMNGRKTSAQGVSDTEGDGVGTVAGDPDSLGATGAGESDNAMDTDGQGWKANKEDFRDLSALFDNINRQQDKETTGAKDTQDKETTGAKDTQDKETTGAKDTEGADRDPTADDGREADGRDDEPEEGGVPDSVEITLPPSPSSDGDTDSGTNKDADTDTGAAGTDEESEEEDARGNPPIFTKPDLQSLAEQIPDDLSPEDREKIRQQLADSLGLSALDPGRAMLPQGLDLQLPSTEKPATSQLSEKPTTPQLPEAFQGPENPSTFNKTPVPHPQSPPGQSNIAATHTLSSESTLDSPGDAKPAVNITDSGVNGESSKRLPDSQVPAAGQENESDKEAEEQHQDEDYEKDDDQEEDEEQEQGQDQKPDEDQKENDEQEQDEEPAQDENEDYDEGEESKGAGRGKMLNDQSVGGDDYHTDDQGDQDKNDDEDYKEDYDYEDDYDYEEDEDGEDYEGGEVNLSPESTLIPVVKGDENEDIVQESNALTEDEATREDAETVDADSMPSFDWKEGEDDDDYQDEEDDWYYNPDNKASSQDEQPTSLLGPSSSTSTPTSKPAAAEDDSSQQDTHSQIEAPDFKEGVISTEDVHNKKALQAPKGTIILYTALIVVFIAGVVLFSLWKNPFKGHNSRSTHQLPVVRTGEEGKRLLDHPFV